VAYGPGLGDKELPDFDKSSNSIVTNIKQLNLKTQSNKSNPIIAGDPNEFTVLCRDQRGVDLMSSFLNEWDFIVTINNNNNEASSSSSSSSSPTIAQLALAHKNRVVENIISKG